MPVETIQTTTYPAGYPAQPAPGYQGYPPAPGYGAYPPQPYGYAQPVTTTTVVYDNRNTGADMALAVGGGLIGGMIMGEVLDDIF